ncbi:PepSY domain-containing protein [Streptomyces antibioticus]|uniref:PepSY domain-containing protein n=1 Tax=Streptomyces antibioticus TaxID=1890 RepID=UPI00224DEABA|nr:PepSY domain-containing protein [Streptomyces antibioticus]MCX4743004.1 PepSY domain-containing protein [Streptomyces antibioticus]
MKRTFAVAAVVTSLALAAAGGTALALADDEPDTGAARTARTVTAAEADTTTTKADTTDKADATDIGKALAAALAHTPGTAVAADREDDGRDAGAWEVDVVTADGTEYTVTVSPDSTEVLGAHRDGGDDDGREDLAALKGTSVDAREAARAVAVKGTVTDVELDDDGGTVAWSVETAKSGAWTVDARTGEVAQDLDD